MNALDSETHAPGRVCPIDYRYSASSIRDQPAVCCDAAWMVGGLYGNLEALEVIERAHAADPVAGARLVFNGDFHWFDAQPDWFSTVQSRVMRHDALRGNVETECAREAFDAEIGCGCAYPSAVDDGVVTRSNRMLAQLWQACNHGGHAAALATLPMFRHLRVGSARVAVVHGDLESLAGWSFDASSRAICDASIRAAQFDVIASSHTCTPVSRLLPAAGDGPATMLMNNGAAGMANLRSDCAGMVTRLGMEPFAALGQRRHAELDVRVLFSRRHAGIWVESIAIDFDLPAWVRRFSSHWPSGSDAELSYGGRIRLGGTVTADEVFAGVMPEDNNRVTPAGNS